MEARSYEALIREVVALANSGAPKEAILGKGIEAKEAIIAEVAEMQRAVNVLDGLIPYYVPEAEWEMGWVNPPRSRLKQETPRVAEPRSRPDHVLAIAQALLEKGDPTVRTDEIAAILGDAGDVTPTRALTTAVGNILTRSGRWERESPGVYRPLRKETV